MTQDSYDLGNFKEWLENSTIQEITQLAHLDTSKVELKPKGSSFDSEAAEDWCRDNIFLYFNDEDHGIYSDPSEDPDFEGTHPDKWEEENPEPYEGDYDDESDYNKALEEHIKERAKARESYRIQVGRWERRMEDKRSAEIEQAVEGCIDHRRELRGESDDGEGYDYKFFHNGEEYNVEMDKQMMRNFGDYRIPAEVMSYNITFSGPQDYSLTGTAGPQAVAIYSKLLAAIKKLMDTEQVDALTFSAYEPAMIPVYDRFMRTYLGDKFTTVAPTTHVRTEKLREIMKKIAPQDRARFEKQIETAQSEREAKVAQVQFAKRLFRKLVSEKGAIIGKITGVKQPDRSARKVYPAVVIDIDPKTIKLLALIDDQGIGIRLSLADIHYDNYGRLADPKNIDPSALQEFRSEFASGKDKSGNKSSAAEYIKNKIPSFNFQFHKFEDMPQK